VLVPLSTLDDHGRIVTLAELRGRMRSLRSGATIAIRDRGFTPSNTTIERGASLRFRWAGRAEHNLKFANGPTPTGSGVRPRGSIDPHRFTVPGRYQFFCSRHPLTMHAQVTVRG